MNLLFLNWPTAIERDVQKLRLNARVLMDGNVISVINQFYYGGLELI